MTYPGIAKSFVSNTLQIMPPQMSSFVFRFIAGLDVSLMRKMLVQRGGLTFWVGKSLLHRRFWTLTDWEENTYRIMKHLLRDDKSFIDLGAWIGPTTLFAAQLARHVYAIEPDPIALRYLCRNLELNQGLAGRVTVVDACIGQTDGIVRLGMSHFPGDSGSSLLLGSKRASWPVKSIRFDRFVREYRINDCNFVKMDIEGAEFLVLPTMGNFLSAERPTLCLSLHPRMSENPETDFRAVVDILEGYTYALYEDGRHVNLDELRNGNICGNQVIVATNEKNIAEISHD